MLKGILWMVKIGVKNFQSIRDAEIEVNGFTAIKGQNNSGKSAFMRAVRYAFQNQKGSSYVRNGEENCSVHVEVGGHSLVWEKGSSVKPSYTIDEQSPIFPGQAIPEELGVFNIGPISAGGREVWPQFAPQFTGQVFLIDLPGSVLAESISDVDKVSILNQALRDSESDRRQASSTLKVRRSDKGAYEKAILVYRDVDTLKAECAHLNSVRDTLSKLREIHDKLCALRDNFLRVNTKISVLQGVLSTPVPDDRPIFDSVSGLDGLRGLRTRLEQNTTTISKMKALSNTKVPNTDSIIGAHDKLVVFKGIHSKYSQVTRDISNLSGFLSVEVPTIPDKLDKLQAALTSMGVLNSRVKSHSLSFNSQQQRVGALGDELGQVTQEIDMHLKGAGVCPLCGTEINERSA